MIRRITQFTSASAAASISSVVERRPLARDQQALAPVGLPNSWNSSSVTYGMKGCSRCTIWSSAHAAVARVSALHRLVLAH